MIFTINTLYTNYIYIKFHALITISTILFFFINHHPFFFLHPNASKLDILPRLKPWDSLNFLTGSPFSKGSDIAVVFRIRTYRRSHVVWYLPGLWSDAGPHIILMLKTETLFH